MIATGTSIEPSNVMADKGLSGIAAEILLKQKRPIDKGDLL